MSSIVTLAIKDLRLLARDRLGLFFIIGFPVLMGVAFGLVNASFADQEVERAAQRIALVDEDGSEMSAAFRAALDAMEALEVRDMSFDAATDAVRKGDLLAVVRISAGFGETAGMMWAQAPVVGLGVDPSRSAEGGMLQGYLMQAMGELTQKRFQNPAGMRTGARRTLEDIRANEAIDDVQKASLETLMSGLDGFLGQIEGLNLDAGAAGAPSMKLVEIETIDVTADPAQGGVTSRLKSGWDISFPSAILWGVLGCVAGFAITIARERSQGTFYRLRVSPLSRFQILAGKGLACFLATLGVIGFMMILGLLLGIQLHSLSLLIVAALCTAFCFSGLMMSMATLGKTETSVSGAGWALNVVMSLFGGGMIPLAFMPKTMATLSNFSPVKWGILAIEGAVWRGFDLREMLWPCAILLAIGAIGFAFGLRALVRSDD
ncbi:MAG: ABC transporter permease [Planctomycetes bacterium]|nr:ABC transporter permease [Planctomycetota bacterium]